MISSNNFNTFNGEQIACHAVYSTNIDVANGIFNITVGSWLTNDISVAPCTTKDIKASYGVWKPEYYHDSDATVMGHPDWTLSEPSRPSSRHVWNPLELVWISPSASEIAQAKVEQWTYIKNCRNASEHAGFMWDSSSFDSDPISQRRIIGAVQLAVQLKAIGEIFLVSWTLKDNSVRTLNGTEMDLVGISLGQHVAEQFTKAQILRNNLNTATTIDKIESIIWYE